MRKLIPVLIILVSCSGLRSDQKKFEEDSKVENMACLEHRDLILKKAAYVTDDGDPKFVPSEKDAIFFIQHFDQTKLGQKLYAEEKNLLLKHCQDKNLEMTLKSCDAAFEANIFFRGLIHAIKEYKWTKATKDRALKLTFKFIRYQTDIDSYLLDKAVAADILGVMVNNELVDKRFKAPIDEIQQQIELSTHDLKRQIQDNESCRGIRLAHQEEYKLAQKIGQQLKSLLEKI